MRILFYTNTNPSIYDAYTINWFQKNYEDVIVVAVDKKPDSKLSIWKKRHKRLGLKRTLIMAKDTPYLKRARKETEARLVELLGYEKPKFHEVIGYDVNGIFAESFIEAYEPDIIVQAGAGILKPNIFNIAPTLNIHYGLSVRGIASPFWSLYYDRQPGVTIHLIDEKIDHGEVLGSHEIDFRYDYHNYIADHVFLW